MNVNLQLNGFISNEEQNVIVGQMKVAIPKNFTTNKKDFICFNNSNNTNPPGICIKKFILNEESYEIWLTRHTDEGSTALVERVGKIAVWFIETADSIDFTDDRWEALFLYHVKSSKVSSSISKPLYYLGGYITLFTFRNRKCYISFLFCLIESYYISVAFAGSKIRVCQALVFPHLQRKGVGKEMLKSVYDIALERNEIVEVTVEDPASGFQRLRDKVEFSLAKSTFQKLGNSIYVIEVVKKFLSITLIQK
jgi:GNAT superfamily N-acetyltransferase